MSSDVRIERLKSDHESLVSLPARSSHVERVEKLVSYFPPDRYRIIFKLPGPINEDFQLSDRFEVEMSMGPDYPIEEGPSFTIRPVLFHPNVWPTGVVCVQASYQHYVGSFRTEDYIRGIGQTIILDEAKINLRSPARWDVDWEDWLDQQRRAGRIPTVSDFYLFDREVTIRRRPVEGPAPEARAGIIIRRQGVADDHPRVAIRRRLAQETGHQPPVTIRRTRRAEKLGDKITIKRRTSSG